MMVSMTQKESERRFKVASAKKKHDVAGALSENDETRNPATHSFLGTYK